MRKSASDPIGTLSVGNVVSAAVSLCKSNFRDYFTVSLRSVGWLVLGILVGLGLVAMAAITNNAGIIVLAVVIWIAFFIFCLAKYAASRGVIARLAYQQLINQPESVSTATSYMAGKHWIFLGLILWLGLFMFGVLCLAYLVLIVLAGVGVAIAAGMKDSLGYIIAGILILAGVVASVWIALRFYSSWFISDLPIAVENCPGGLDAIGRSRQLSTPFLSRISIVMFVAFLVTLPLNILANVPSLGVIGQSSNSGASIFFQAVSTILGLLLELFLIPFWQSIKAVIYFDLRSRREGNDLQMR
jgi:hypothetical protein